MDEVINLSTTLSVILQLGRVGENNANSITFDFSDWQSEFGEGTVSLTPTEVRTILGYNNIYADSGEVSVVYYRDLDIVINRLLEGSASL